MTINPTINILSLFNTYLLSKSYSKLYYLLINSYIKYCLANNIDIYNINYTSLQAYIVSLVNKELDNGSINNCIKAIRTFYKFLLASKLITDNILQEALQLKQLPYERKIKSYFTLEEIDDMIEMHTSFGRTNPYKVKAILYFLYFTGLRKGELMNLKRQDISFADCSVIVRNTKNNLQRIVFFPKDLIPILEDYFKEPEQVNAFNLKNGEVGYLVACLKQYTPKNKIFTLHTLRHSFARMLASKQIDSRIAQKLLGHKKIENTLIYYDPDIDIIKQIYDKNIKLKPKKRKRAIKSS